MFWRKQYLRKLYSSKLDQSSKLRLSKDLFRERKAYIFAAGPSLNRVMLNQMADELNENMVLCIKQSYAIVGRFCDAMAINLCNYQPYQWDEFNCPVIWAAFEDNHRQVFHEKKVRHDFVVDIYDNRNNKGSFDKTVARRSEWDRLYDFADSRACWGPGLMYEVAIPFALHLGVAQIVLVGWDIGTVTNANGYFSNNHFYNNKVEIPTGISNEEIMLVGQSAGELRRWLAGRNVQLSIVSDSSAADASIPRDLRWIAS